MAGRYSNARWLAILLMAVVWLSSDDDDSSSSSSQVHAFAIQRLPCSMTRQNRSKEYLQIIMLHALGQGGRDFRDEAEDLLSKARELREQIGATDQKAAQGSKSTKDSPTRNLQWSVKDEKNLGDEYRLYIDIGREEGTWMERRWGAWGRRIPFSLDIRFLSSLASDSDAAVMVKDNYMGKSSACYSILTADAARLRDGFDKMVCNGGCYRIDSAKRKDTVRFYLNVAGTNPEQDYGYVLSFYSTEMCSTLF